MLRCYLSDACGVAAQGMRTQNCQCAISRLRRDEEDHLAFIGDVHRIEAKQFAGRLDLSAYRQARFVDLDTDV